MRKGNAAALPQHASQYLKNVERYYDLDFFFHRKTQRV